MEHALIASASGQARAGGRRGGDFAVNYQLNVYSGTPGQTPRILARLNENILDVFNEYGVQIMTPAYEGDPEEPKVVPPTEWFLPPAVKDGV